MTTGRPPVRLPCLNDQQSDNTELVAEGWGASSAIAVSFEDDRNAYNALTSLMELDSHQRVGVRVVGLPVLQQVGHVVEMDRVESMSPPPHGGRRTHRLLIGIIGGPLGMLIGGATGLMVGSPCDLEDIDETESALGVISSTRPGWADRTAGGCERAESRCRRPAAMSDLGGTVLRRSVAAVGAEIAAAGGRGA